MPQNMCPQHPDQPIRLAVEYRIPDPYGPGVDYLDPEIALACTDECARDARMAAYMAGADPGDIDTRPATADDIAEVTGMEVTV